METSRTMEQSGSPSFRSIHGIRRAPVTLAVALLAVGLIAPAAPAAVGCRGGDFALSDAQDMARVRGAIERACPCANLSQCSRPLCS